MTRSELEHIIRNRRRIQQRRQQPHARLRRFHEGLRAPILPIESGREDQPLDPGQMAKRDQLEDEAAQKHEQADTFKQPETEE